MKKKLLFGVIILSVIGSITGCQGNNKDINEAMRTLQKVETESISNEAVEESQEKIYNIEDYGIIEEKKQEFFGKDTEVMSYYYIMEEFFINDNLSNAVSVNEVLQQIYDGYEEKYIENGQNHQQSGLDEFGEEIQNVSYDQWHILALCYAGEDYISILYNDIGYFGGVHPYSCFDGITIDCRTGQEVFVSELLGRSDEDILTEISSMMGLDITATWKDIDFYLTDSTIVFFYRMPGFFEDVVLPRGK